MRVTNKNITIFEALQNISEGKYVMPAFQRQFVWSMYQIEKLWDSIMLDYPIATFLYWKIDNNNTTWETYFCNFLETAQFDNRKSSDSLNFDLIRVDTTKTDTAILDGQQRLTSLFISLIGEARIRQKHSRRRTPTLIHTDLFIELDLTKIDIEEEFNGKIYDIKFTEKMGRVSPTQFKIRDIMKSEFRNNETRDEAIEIAIRNVSPKSKEYAKETLLKLYNRVFVHKIVHVTEIEDMKQDDALEMFVRFNSGGKPLRKSEITMSMLQAYWPSSRREFGLVLRNEYAGFGTEFIIRAALMLFGDVVKSSIDRTVVNDLKDNWSEFVISLGNLHKLIKSFNIDFQRFQTSWNVLLPILYSVFYNPHYEENAHAIQVYLTRAIVFNLFQSGTTQRLQMMRSNINEFNKEITIEMLDQITELRVTDARIEDILDKEKGTRVVSETLYYLSLNWTDNRFKYEVDHLHPFDAFDRTRPPQITREAWLKMTTMRNKLPNLHLLEGRENASKGEMRLEDYINDMNEEQRSSFLENAIIPLNLPLELEKFEEFYVGRQNELTRKIKEMLN